MINYMIGILAGGTIANLAWILVWIEMRRSLRAAEQFLRDSHAREEKLEVMLDRETSGDWWKGNNE